MFNTYSSPTTNNTSIKVNAVSGTIVKNYNKSWFQRFHLKSQHAEEILRFPDNRNPYNRSKYDDVVVLQMMVCGDMEVIVELIKREDLDAELGITIKS